MGDDFREGVRAVSRSVTPARTPFSTIVGRGDLIVEDRRCDFALFSEPGPPDPGSRSRRLVQVTGHHVDDSAVGQRYTERRSRSSWPRRSDALSHRRTDSLPANGF